MWLRGLGSWGCTRATSSKAEQRKDITIICLLTLRFLSSQQAKVERKYNDKWVDYLSVPIPGILYYFGKITPGGVAYY